MCNNGVKGVYEQSFTSMQSYTDSKRRPKKHGPDNRSVDVVIIGAGISGLCAAIDMVRQGNGRNFLIFEKSNQVGGTWNDNVYPGCCCDVWGHLYSYSFEPNPNWTREYPSQKEILDYLISVANKWHLYERIQFNTEVERAQWDEDENKWRVRVRRQDSQDVSGVYSYTIAAEYLIAGVGQLSLPKYPSIAGLESFSGKVMHSARWDCEFDLLDRRIGIIGSGSTASQIVPAIADRCRELIVYQRSPTWVMPRCDDKIGLARRLAYRYIPGILKRRREQLMDIRESHFRASFEPDSGDSRTVTWLSQNHLKTQLAGSWNAELRCKLTPHYAFNCKRIIVSDDYYPALARDNVRLETARIAKITQSGVTLLDGRTQALDLIVLATGFETARFMHPISIIGRKGRTLDATWSHSTAAYLGITVDGFPNFGMLYGPNTNLAYNSLILQIEAQSLYISRMVQAVLSAKRQGLALSLEPRAPVVTSFNEKLQERLAKSAFADPRCTSWFKTASGKIINNWCGSAVEYQELTSYIDWSDFNIQGTAAYLWRDKPRTQWGRVVEESRPRNANWVRILALILVGGMMLTWYYTSRDRMI